MHSLEFVNPRSSCDEIPFFTLLLTLSACTVSVQPNTPGTGASPSASPSANLSGGVLVDLANLNAAALQVSTNADASNPTERPANLASESGVVVNVSSTYGGWPKERLVDRNLETSWFTAVNDAANLGKQPYVEVIFPKPVRISSINLWGNREYKDGYDVLEGRLTLTGSNGSSGSMNVVLPQPDRDFSLKFAAPIGQVTKLRFDFTKDESEDPGFAEIEVIGQVE